jgi:predicted ribosome quality control (RQC) complex YloA/Tae2 family protein
MPLDGITAKCLAVELNKRLADARLDRIHQPDRSDIILQFRRGSENVRMIISANPAAPRLHLTSESRENPSEPPMFCMLLRKHLAGARLIDISTPGYERIFQFRFSTVNEIGDRLEKILVAEIMGRHSNIILLNHENRIHDAIFHIDQSISRVREIMPARQYQLPPVQNKISPEHFLDYLADGRNWLSQASGVLNLEKALLETLQGFSPQLCRELAYQAGIDPRIKISQLTDGMRAALTTATHRLINNILEGRFMPTAFFDSAEAKIPVDFHALPLQDYPWQKNTITVSRAMDLFYLERNRQNSLNQKKHSLAKAISNQLDHVQKKLQIHEADLLASENREQYRLFGELILANMNLEKPNMSELSAIDYYHESQPVIQIPLESSLSLARNAQHYFKLYNKAKIRFETSQRLAEEDRQDIAWLESLSNALAMAQEPDDITAIREEISSTGLNQEKQNAGRHSASQTKTKPAELQPGKPGNRNRRLYQGTQASRKKNVKGQAKKTALPPRQYVSSDGLQILVGRNNLQNDQLTLKTAQKDDLWLHVQKMPGTHVIIRTNHQPVPEGTLLEAAEVAAWFSKAAASLPQYRENMISSGPLQKVAVDYCPVSHVRKPAGARPGMVIYDRYQTLLVSPREPKAPV